VAGDFHAQSRTIEPKDDEDAQHEECTRAGISHGDLQAKEQRRDGELGGAALMRIHKNGQSLDYVSVPL
jgi:hypothetical protein